MCISMCVSMCISRHTAPSCCRLVLLLRSYHFLQHHLFSHHITPYCQYTNSAVSAFVRLTRSNRSAFCSVGRVLTVPGRTCEESEAQGRVPGPATDLRVRSSKQASKRSVITVVHPCGTTTSSTAQGESLWASESGAGGAAHRVGACRVGGMIGVASAGQNTLVCLALRKRYATT